MFLAQIHQAHRLSGDQQDTEPQSEDKTSQLHSRLILLSCETRHSCRDLMVISREDCLIHNI